MPAKEDKEKQPGQTLPGGAEIRGAVGGRVKDSRGISFVDDITWLVEGTNLNDVVNKLERCAAGNNAVRFETSKTETILFSRKRKHRRCNRTIKVGDQSAMFAPEATPWLAIWLDSTLSLPENRRRRIAKTHQAEARLRRIVNKYGAPPAAARNLQTAIVQGTMLYAAEFTWNGQKGIEREYHPHGTLHTRCLQVDPTGHRRRRERPSAR